MARKFPRWNTTNGQRWARSQEAEKRVARRMPQHSACYKSRVAWSTGGQVLVRPWHAALFHVGAKALPRQARHLFLPGPRPGRMGPVWSRLQTQPEHSLGFFLPHWTQLPKPNLQQFKVNVVRRSVERSRKSLVCKATKMVSPLHPRIAHFEWCCIRRANRGSPACLGHAKG